MIKSGYISGKWNDKKINETRIFLSGFFYFYRFLYFTSVNNVLANNTFSEFWHIILTELNWILFYRPMTINTGYHVAPSWQPGGSLVTSNSFLNWTTSRLNTTMRFSRSIVQLIVAWALMVNDSQNMIIVFLRLFYKSTMWAVEIITAYVKEIVWTDTDKTCAMEG